jgi:hypothetical protein
LKNKELGQEGWAIIYACGGCEDEDFIEQAFLAHKVACKQQIYVGKVGIKPSYAAKHMVQFRAKHMRTESCHPAQFGRLMSNSGLYVFAPEMVGNGVLLQLVMLCMR